MVDAAPHAVMLCNLLRHGLEQWAARGSNPGEAAGLIGVLWIAPRRPSEVAIIAAQSALDDADDAVERARDHVRFMAAPPRVP